MRSKHYFILLLPQIEDVTIAMGEMVKSELAATLIRRCIRLMQG